MCSVTSIGDKQTNKLNTAYPHQTGNDVKLSVVLHTAVQTLCYEDKSATKQLLTVCRQNTGELLQTSVNSVKI